MRLIVNASDTLSPEFQARQFRKIFAATTVAIASANIALISPRGDTSRRSGRCRIHSHWSWRRPSRIW